MSKDGDISYHRPFLRSSLARSLYERMIREEQLRNFDRIKWYKCDLSLLTPQLEEKFVEMQCDEDTEAFIETCYEKSDWFFTHLFHTMARSILCLFMTSTSVNGLLGRGSMFVFSNRQFDRLYDDLPLIKSTPDTRLLDVGAGDGKVTHIMAQYFREVHVTEISPVMKRILSKRGYIVLDPVKWYEDPAHYDLISCLNLLDRCEKPLTYLNLLKGKLKPEGKILLALVLPFSQYVETTSGNNSHKASELLPIRGDTFESQFLSFEENVIKPNGMEIVKWTRLPYLCEGDLDLSFYWLYDVVMILKMIPNPQE